MSNRYFYLSSLGANNHSDFECTLPEQVVISPYSQVRCISCRINPSDNLMEIDDTNDLFYVGVDHWIKKNACIPLLPVKMTKGLYDMMDGDDDFLNLSAEIKERLDEVLEPYCLLRGGSDVSINESSRKLKIKLSTMQLYECPTIALTDAVKLIWFNENANQLRTQVGNDMYDPIVRAGWGQLDPFGGTTYNGMSLGKVRASPQYHIGAPIVTGLVNVTDQAKHVSHIIECDFTGLDNNAEELGATHTQPADFIRIYFGDAKQSEFGTKWGHEPKLAAVGAPITPLDEKFMYALEFCNANVNLRYNEIQADGSVATSRKQYGSGANYRIANKYQVIVEEWDSDYTSYWGFTIKRDDGQGGGYADMANMVFHTEKVINRQHASNAPNRLAVQFKTDFANMDGMVRYTAAVDDDTNGFIGGGTDAFQAHTSNTADMNRLLSVFSNNVGGADTISDRVFRTMENDIVSANYADANNDVLDRMYRPGKMPNADILSWDSNSDDGIVTSTASWTTGLQAEGGVSANNRDFPSFYLSIPSLPIQNYTGNHLAGAEQTFVCPIELSQSQTSQRLYTSKQYTEQYSSLTNSYPLNISTLKVRICDISGKPTSQLQKYTLVVLEIRDNPKTEHEELLNSLRSLVDNYNRPVKLIGDQ